MWAIAYLAQLHPLEGTRGDMRFFLHESHPDLMVYVISPEDESCAGALRCNGWGWGSKGVHSYVRRWPILSRIWGSRLYSGNVVYHILFIIAR